MAYTVIAAAEVAIAAIYAAGQVWGYAALYLILGLVWGWLAVGAWEHEKELRAMEEMLDSPEWRERLNRLNDPPED